jgi:predicted XRE-type DNA-binding protein
MAKKSAVRVTASTGSVFRDVGFSKEESEHLLIRADLLIHVQKAIASRGLKQAEAAKVLQVTQPRVSDLPRGRIDLFSTDVLIHMLARLGIGVRLVVKRSVQEGRVRIAYMVRPGMSHLPAAATVMTYGLATT